MNWDRLDLVLRVKPPSVTMLVLMLVSSARAEEVRPARAEMREAAIEKADVEPMSLPDLHPPDPRRPSSPEETDKGTHASSSGHVGRADAAVRAEAHRLSMEAAAHAAGLGARGEGGPSAAPTPRAAENNASAQGQAHSAAAAARAGGVRRMGAGAPGQAGNGNGKR